MDPKLVARLARQRAKEESGEGAVGDDVTPRRSEAAPGRAAEVDVTSSRSEASMEQRLKDRLAQQREKVETGRDTTIDVRSQADTEPKLDTVLARRFAKRQEKLDTGASAIEAFERQRQVSLEHRPSNVSHSLSEKLARQLAKAEPAAASLPGEPEEVAASAEAEAAAEVAGAAAEPEPGAAAAPQETVPEAAETVLEAATAAEEEQGEEVDVAASEQARAPVPAALQQPTQSTPAVKSGAPKGYAGVGGRDSGAASCCPLWRSFPPPSFCSCRRSAAVVLFLALWLGVKPPTWEAVATPNTQE